MNWSVALTCFMWHFGKHSQTVYRTLPTSNPPAYCICHKLVPISQGHVLPAVIPAAEEAAPAGTTPSKTAGYCSSSFLLEMRSLGFSCCQVIDNTAIGLGLLLLLVSLLLGPLLSVLQLLLLLLAAIPVKFRSSCSAPSYRRWQQPPDLCAASHQVRQRPDIQTLSESSSKCIGCS